jgi:hypothetical protein
LKVEEDGVSFMSLVFSSIRGRDENKDENDDDDTLLIETHG